MTHERTERPTDCLPGCQALDREETRLKEIFDGEGRALVTVPHRVYAKVMRYPDGDVLTAWNGPVVSGCSWLRRN